MSTTDTPDEIRPLTEQELAIQCLHDVATHLADAYRSLCSAWPSMPANLRASIQEERVVRRLSELQTSLHSLLLSPAGSPEGEQK